MFAGAYDLGAMDANASYSLVPLPLEQRALVPVSTALVADPVLQDDGQFNPLAFLWHCFCQLALLFWLAVLAIRELQRQLVELRCQANFWRAQHQRAVAREAILATRVRHLQAEIRELKRRLFALKSETASAAEPKKTTPPGKNKDKPRSRGQQPGSKGHGRRNYDHLPTSHEDCVLPEAQKCCPACGESYEEIPGTADGDILETEVRAHRRRYHRKRYRRCCDCAINRRCSRHRLPTNSSPKATSAFPCGR